MTDLEARLERFENLATECEMIGRFALDGTKRELYSRLALHYRQLIEDMRSLLNNPEKARWLGNNAHCVARTRFGLDRFIRDWNNAFSTCLGMKTHVQIRENVTRQ